VKLITTVFGNCGLDQVIKNVAKCRSAANTPDISISKGCEFPIIKESLLDATYFHGLDGMGNNSFPDECSGIEDHHPQAPQQLIDIAKEAKLLDKDLTLVMIGPLTNLAEAIRMDPTFVQDIHHLVVMGGCGNGRGNVFRTTEFNVVADPDAASIVFHNLVQNNKVCTVVSWELTMNATIPWKLFDQLNNEVTAAKSRLNDFLCVAVK
jgi:purine nucleosidase